MQFPSSHAASLAWFVVFTEASEFSVEADLIELRERADLVIDAYCPAETRWCDYQRGRARVQVPLYPGYVFVGIAATSHGVSGPEYPIGEIEQVRGVGGIVRSTGALVQLPYDPPDPEFLRFSDRAPQNAWSIFGLREQERCLGFDYTRGMAHSRRAAKAVKRAKESFRGLRSAEWAARWLTMSGELTSCAA